MDNIKPLVTVIITVALILITWGALYAATYIASLLSGVDYFTILVALAAVATAVLAAFVWRDAKNEGGLLRVKLFDPLAARRGLPFAEEFIVKAEPAYHEGEYYVYDAIGYYILTREQIILTRTREIPTKLVHSLVIMEEPKDLSKWEYHRALKAYLDGKEFIERASAAARAASMSVSELGKAFADFGEIVRRASERHH